MSNTEEMDPPHLFIDPNRVTISSEALALVIEFTKLLPRNGKNWVVSFDWAFSRRYREKNSDIWHDIGPGIDLTAYEEHEVPSRRICVIGKIKIVFKIPENVFNCLNKKTIDVDKIHRKRIIIT
jgi:hypothetical protein